MNFLMTTTLYVLLTDFSFGALDRGMQSRPPLRGLTFNRGTTTTTTTTTTTQPSLSNNKDVSEFEDFVADSGIESASEIAVVATVPKLAVTGNRPTCPLGPRKENVVAGTSHTRKPVGRIALVPGKKVHCSRTKQSTSGLDCPCNETGVACAPTNSICSIFSAELSTCGCNLGTSVRKGARCEALSNSISARGIGFRIFAPAPVLEVSCKTAPCHSVGTINTLMGTPPYVWTVTRTFTTNNVANLTERSNAKTNVAEMEIDTETAAVRFKSSVDCQQQALLPLPSKTTPSWAVPHVQVYTVSAKDADNVSSNMIILTIFFDSDC